jgi:predicted Zn-dependent protease with MMP-like domain
LRNEFEWLAAALGIEGVILPILEGREPCGVTQIGPAHVPHEGFDVPIEEFQQIVAEALDALPKEFGLAMHNVAIVVEEEADGRRLFGRYEGVPLTRRRYRQWYVHPDRITIYRGAICAFSHSEEEVRAQVYMTLIHEVAHHFGISDPRLEELGW